MLPEMKGETIWMWGRLAGGIWPPPWSSCGLLHIGWEQRHKEHRAIRRFVPSLLSSSSSAEAEHVPLLHWALEKWSPFCDGPGPPLVFGWKMLPRSPQASFAESPGSTCRALPLLLSSSAGVSLVPCPFLLRPSPCVLQILNFRNSPVRKPPSP